MRGKQSDQIEVLRFIKAPLPGVLFLSDKLRIEGG